MFDFLYQMRDINIFVIFSLITIIVSFIFIYLVRHFIPLEIRYKNNEVIGNTSALIGLLYGVLAGLSALYLIDNNTVIADAVQREANSIANIHRESLWLTDPAKTNIQKDLKAYLENVINVEWPLMKSGQIVSKAGGAYIDHISLQLQNFNIQTEQNKLIIQELLNELKLLYDARQDRIQMSYATLDPEIWVVVLIGTILTLCINYLFGMNFYLHVISVTFIALITSSMLFLLVTLDRPFQGDFSIEPNGLKEVLQQVSRP